MDLFTKTSREFITENRITRQRAYELRNGVKRVLKSGKLWHSPPKLHENQDFIFKRGKILYRIDLQLPVSKRGRKRKEEIT